MSQTSIIPVLAALLCTQTAALFAALYWRGGRRTADLVFSGLAAALAVMTWSSYMTALHSQTPAMLFWIRMQYAGAFAAITVFLHFAAVVTNEPLPAGTVLSNYLLGAVLVAFTQTDLFLRAAGPGAPQVAEPGRLYRVLVPLLLIEACFAWRKLQAVARRQAGGTFAPLDAHLPTILLGAGIVLVSGAIVIFMVLVYPSVHLGFSPHSFGAAVFCVLTGVALARELDRAERDRSRLRELITFRDEAVRDLAHELRNPLAGIVTGAETLLLIPVDEATRREMLQLTLQAGQRLLRLLNNMLDTARLEAGRGVELRLSPIDLPAVAQSVLDGQKLATTIHELRLDNQMTSPTVFGDGDKLHQILQNLVHNAVKYSPHGGCVTVRLANVGSLVELIVTDQGIGFSDEQAARLFQPFERVADPARKLTGTGIGLHLVKRLVEVHGGTISVQGRLGDGATITVRIPRRPEG